MWRRKNVVWTASLPVSGGDPNAADVPYAVRTLLLYESLQAARTTADLTKSSTYAGPISSGIAGGMALGDEPYGCGQTRLQTNSDFIPIGMEMCTQAVWLEEERRHFLRGLRWCTRCRPTPLFVLRAFPAVRLRVEEAAKQRTAKKDQR
jgi:hypothetical protein